MLLSLVAIMVFFQVMTDGTLLQPLNLTNLVLQNSYIVIMALGMLLVIVAGHIDLSVGSVVGFIGALAAVLMVELRRRTSCSAVDRLPRSSARRIGAAQGYWVAYLPDPVLHRDAGRHAGVQGPGLALLRASRSGRSRRPSSCSARASFPTHARTARHAAARPSLRARRACVALGAASIASCASARQAARARHARPSRSRSSSARTSCSPR